MYLRKTRPFQRSWKVICGGGGCIWIIVSALWSRVFSIRVPGPKQDLDQEHGLWKVSGGGGWWVGVSVIIALALVLLRQELKPVLENSLGQWPGPGLELDNCDVSWVDAYILH